MKSIFIMFLKMYTLLFQNTRDSLTITDLIFDIKLYLNTLSIQVLRLMSNSAAVLHLRRTRLNQNIYLKSLLKGARFCHWY